MNLFFFEIQKLIRQKSIWIILIICLGMNALFLCETEQMKYSYSPKMYCDLQEQLKGMSATVSYEWLANEKNQLNQFLQSEEYLKNGKLSNEICLRTNNEWQENDLLNDAIEDRRKILEYDQYIKEIRQNAQTMQKVSILFEK